MATGPRAVRRRPTPPTAGLPPGGATWFWPEAFAAWFDRDAAAEAGYVRFDRLAGWKHDDRRFAASCEEAGDDADLRVVEQVRQRAAEGDPVARGLTFRANRGFARPVDASPSPEPVGALPPEVASAMLDAGLAAMGLAAADPARPRTLPPG